MIKINGLIFTIGICFLLVFAYTEEASAQVPRKIIITCIDAQSGTAVGCEVSRVPPKTSSAIASPSELELLDPIIRFRAEASVSGYDAREVEVNAASFKKTDLWLRIALAPSFPPGRQPSLQSINKVRTLLGSENTIDRGFALMEQITEFQTTIAVVGTFAVRYKYWHMSALLKACTLSFYQSCSDAETALQELRIAIKQNPEEFLREHVSENSINSNKFDMDIKAAQINKTVHRANWYLALKDLERAREEYNSAQIQIDSALADLNEKDKKYFEEHIAYNDKNIEKNIRYIDTLKSQEG